MWDSRQDPAVQTPLHGHAARGTEPGQALRSLTGAGSGQGRAARRSRASPPPAEPRSAPGSGRAAAAGAAVPQRRDRRCAPGAPSARPPSRPAARSGWDGMGRDEMGAGRPPQAGLRERERLPGRRHHGNALPPWRGEPCASPPPRRYRTAVPEPGGAGGARKQRRSPRLGGRAVGTERGPSPRRLPSKRGPRTESSV